MIGSNYVVYNMKESSIGIHLFIKEKHESCFEDLNILILTK